MKKSVVSRMVQLALAGAMLLPTAFASAGEPTPAESRAQVSTARTIPSPVFDDLKQADDPKLESQRAGYRHYHEYYYHHGLTGGEVVLCVLLLIFLFPIGLIVTIVLVLTD